MKMRLALALLGLAIGSALPTLAQQQNAVDAEVRQQIEAFLVKGDEAYNKHDAAALAAGYTEDAVFVGGGSPGPHYGRQAIEQRNALDMASTPGESSHELLQVYEVGIDVCAIAKLRVGIWKGYAVLIFVREANGWKIRNEYDGTMIE